jgi:cyanophycin synthetase
LVLSNKEVEAAVLETARGGIIKRGLGYDLADIGVITNVSDDHLGVDGSNTLEDLAYAKSLVIEAIKPDGYAVLNADDCMTEYFLKRVSSNVILFSKDKKNPLIQQYTKEGKKVVYIDNNWLCICNSNNIKYLINIHEIPITYGGANECNIENALAAVSSLYAINMPLSVIRTGLKSFKPEIELNPGRFNIFDMNYFKIILDYAHNPAGYREVSKFIKKVNLNHKRLVGIIGMPGDRLDSSIWEVGAICGSLFDKIYIKEDNDLRGRNPGEVADILYDAIIKNGAKKENIEALRRISGHLIEKETIMGQEFMEILNSISDSAA